MAARRARRRRTDLSRITLRENHESGRHDLPKNRFAVVLIHGA
jgi:hypothetical protein